LRGSSSAVDAFYSKPKDVRDRAVRRVIRYFITLYERDPARAVAEFVRWIASEDGAIVWGYLCRRDFVDEWVALYRGIVRLLARLGQMISGPA